MQEFDFGTFVTRARQGWMTPVIFALALVMFTLFTLSFARPVYRVTMTVMEAPSDQNTQVSATSGLSALFGLAGQSGGNYSRYQKLLGSTVVAQRLQDKYGMLQYVFRNNWDAKNKVWVPHFTFRDEMVGWLLRLSHVPVWTPPDITTLALYLQNSLVIIPGAANDIVSISMDNQDVDFAKHVMLATDEQANQVLRDQVALRARQQVAYLQTKLAETTVEDYRQTLLALLGNEEKTLMLTQTNAAYAAQILSPPVASAIPIAPRPVLSTFVAGLVGGLTGLAVVIFFGPLWWRNLYERGLRLLASLSRPKALASRR
jgi:uncharacterized protein involved in exopolysaccharide biosynthesis